MLGWVLLIICSLSKGLQLLKTGHFNLKHFEVVPFLSAYVPPQNAKRRLLRSSCFRCIDLCEYTSPITALEPVHWYSQNWVQKCWNWRISPSLSFLNSLLSPWTVGFDSKLVNFGFVMDTKAVGPVFLRGYWFCPASIVPQLLRTHSFNCHRRWIILVTNRVVKWRIWRNKF
jgi:hypothetical protein